MPLSREDDQNAAMVAIAPILPLVNDILNGAVEFYFGENYTDAARAQHTARAAANCIYSHAERLMLDAEGSRAGLHILDVRGLRVMNWRDQALLRFKKVDGNGRSSNYQTKQQQDYDDQLPIPDLPDPAVRLTAGYELAPAGVGLNRVIISRRVGQGMFWSSQVIFLENEANWVDITPQRFAGMGDSDFNAARARRARSGR
ncbi:hypothetical protein [Devosia sp. Root436]|uniref:hypothetical protein n=1 Tax=Devosia sp. Root436 TaxID=1736537 RepID=UPI000B21A223|nr:hypothetical protein [Devosia sp. Root436]